MEGCVAIPLLLPYNITVVTFDWAGCGQSEGDYISLGWFECDDLSILIHYLLENRKVSKVSLWGRSMGAATALMYTNYNPGIKSLVLDSPFASLRELVMELSSSNTRIPKFLLKGLYEMVRNSIRGRIAVDIDMINPIN